MPRANWSILTLGAKRKSHGCEKKKKKKRKEKEIGLGSNPISFGLFE
jgi:hypothetical protein